MVIQNPVTTIMSSSAKISEEYPSNKPSQNLEATNKASVTTQQSLSALYLSNISNPLSTLHNLNMGLRHTSAIDHYRVQLYNYAINMERFRYPQYNPSTAIRAANFSSSSNSASAIVNATAYLHNGQFSLPIFPQRFFPQEEPKPQHSYIGLIAMAILSSPDSKLVLSDIYQYILDNYPYFRTRGPGWRNSIRHNLSLNYCFIKSGRSANGKGHYWAIHPANIDDFRRGDFRRRKAQRKVRKHMGLSVDDQDNDSPSPPPLDLTSPPSPQPISSVSSIPSNTFPYMQHNPPISTFRQQQARYYQQQFHSEVSNKISNQGSDSSKHLVSAAIHNCIKLSQNTNSINQQEVNNLIEEIELEQPNDARPYFDVLHSQVVRHQFQNTAPSSADNLYTKPRKRQFDVASLLAPETITNIPNSVGIAKTEHTFITKVSVQQSIQQNIMVAPQFKQPLQSQSINAEEDIDVVASDVEHENNISLQDDF
ncbi:forkhead box protein A2-A-like [Teleopsis dalmanni]|uniref:forkhead box protein A2-A-like n=1 Tax=Teleopsis dalmanni TaxID=139649 RepID=UPI0018CCB4A7|nr:forkhead box protein A2-A-like [Teleopsis dalmanni]